MHSPGKTHDRKKCVTGDTTSVEESSQVITDHQKAASKLGLHLGMLPTDKKIFPENRDPRSGSKNYQRKQLQMSLFILL